MKNMDQALNKISLLLMNNKGDQNQNLKVDMRSISPIVLQNSTQKVLNTKEKKQ